MKIPEFMETIGGLSENTRHNYEQTLWQLRANIAGEEPTDDEIYLFLKKYPSNSLHRHKAAIKAYLEYREPERRWPFTRRTFAQRRRRIPIYIPPEVVPEIANAGDRDDYMFVWTLFQLGCRISELMDIFRDDITATGVKLMTKGGWARLATITKEFRVDLLKYAKNKKGKIFPHTYNYYKKKLEELGRKAGYEGKVNPHMLRHARAVDLLLKGMPLAFVQQFLGHANINTTAIYLQITGGELSKQLERVEFGDLILAEFLAKLNPQQLDRLKDLILEGGRASVVA